jgi:putative ABC transport system permease protein
MALRVHARGAATLYVPGVRPDWAQMTVRAADPQALAGPVREAVRAVTATAQPTVMIIADRFGRELAAPRRYAGLAIAIALLTLTLSVVGLSGVTMFTVQARMHESGVRLALGAGKGVVTRVLLRDGLRAVLIGLAVGLVGAWIAGRYISSLLYGMSEHDPLALVGAVAVLLGSAMAAVFLPTRRAAALDPAVVLREG